MNRDEATENQVRAADPGMSTWLSANAGSGKTRVLTDRVARLLLQGVDPQKILCLTYTKAAAGEMQNRLFRRLGQWTMLPDDKLSGALDELGVPGKIEPERLRRARTLFARAIETPGGLKIQTIHSFCASLLRRFPLEAGVSPQFSEMEDRATALLHEEILEDLASGPERYLVDGLAQYATDQTLVELVNQLAGMRESFDQTLTPEQLQIRLGLPRDYGAEKLAQEVFDGSERGLFDAILPVLRTGGATDSKAAAKLSEIGQFTVDVLPVLENVLLFGEGAKAPFAAKLGSFPTKAGQTAIGLHLDPLQSLMVRVQDARSKRLALAAAEKSAALHRFAAAFLPELERRKQLHGWLDFDDLIQKTRQLLDAREVAEWVLFRLDGGIDHILVDEAQDTSPDQWDVIEKLAREFTTGQGARSDVVRTLFVVGDTKQSIYSFQGADPDAFNLMREEFASRFAQIGSGLQDQTLDFSFRSSDAILRLVDHVFEHRSDAGFVKEAQHRAFKSDLPGRVDLWPAVPEADKEEGRHWTDPLDQPGNRHHSVVLAERIAGTIAQMLADGTTVPVDSPKQGTFARRPVRPGDFLILLQRRSDLFSEIIRACKGKSLPIAGADRLRVGAELAVKDLASLLRFLATPEDSLALAEALRSPLFGWTEQELFDLSHRRDDPFLWQALRARASEFPETMTVLSDLRSQTDFLRPYDLIERILTRHTGRKSLLARLGREAEDGIDALLAQALAYERTQVPSLTGFLVWMETDDLEIKRQTDNTGNLIRVMTVHGAKGLESPIVILPDTARRQTPPGQDIMIADGVPYWRPPAAELPNLLRTARDERRERDLNERARLLYVALTRAEKWLIVAAAGKVGEPGDSWYSDIDDAMRRSGAVPEDMPGGPGLRLNHLDWSDPPIADVPEQAEEPVDLPAHFSHPPTRTTESIPIVNPSDLGGAKALPGELGLDSDAAMERGTLIHTLLEHLPGADASDWDRLAAALLPQNSPPDVLQEVHAVLTTPDLSFLFGPDALAEVSIAADLGRAKLQGTIDRLIVHPDRVLAVDFKSNMVVPDSPDTCPEGLLRQLGAYAHALAQIYPDRTIETAILWTRTATYMQISHDLVMAALARTGWLDDAPPPS